MFFKTMALDLKHGVLLEWKRFLLAASAFLFFCVTYSLIWLNNAHGTTELLAEGRTLGDHLLYITAGMKQYVFDPRDPFQFPALWMLWLLLLLYTTLSYPYRDLMGCGKQLLVASGSRSGWWASKCLWVFGCNVLYWGLLLLVALVFSAVTGVELSLRVSQSALYLCGFDPRALYAPPWDLGPVLLLAFAAMLTLSFVQLTLSLLLRPFVGFLCMIILLFLSAFFQFPWLIGNYAMAARSAALVSTGLEPFWGWFLCLCLSALSILGGWAYFRHMDILNREGA